MEAESKFGLGVSEEPGEEICLGGLGLGGNYVWCFVIVAIFLEFGGAKKWEGGFEVII